MGLRGLGSGVVGGAEAGMPLGSAGVGGKEEVGRGVPMAEGGWMGGWMGERLRSWTSSWLVRRAMAGCVGMMPMGGRICAAGCSIGVVAWIDAEASLGGLTKGDGEGEGAGCNLGSARVSLTEDAGSLPSRNFMVGPGGSGT